MPHVHLPGHGRRGSVDAVRFPFWIGMEDVNIILFPVLLPFLFGFLGIVSLGKVHFVIGDKRYLKKYVPK